MKKIIYVMALASLAFVACNKENISPKSESETQILAFKNAEEYQNTLSLVSQMSDDEFTQWEKSRNFISFERAAMKIFNAANFDNLESKEEIIAFATTNSQYFQLLELDGIEGDLTLETKLYKHGSLKKIINSGSMVQIGDTVYKMFDDGVAFAPLNKSKQLNTLSEKKFSSNFVEDKDVTIVKNSRKKDLFEKAHNNRITNGSNRLYLGIEIKFRLPIPDINHYKVEYTLRPYHKTLGVWLFCSRTIWGEINFTVRTPEYPDYIERTYPLPQANLSVYEGSYTEPVTSNVGNGWGFDFKEIHCWGKSGSIPNETVRIDEVY